MRYVYDKDNDQLIPVSGGSGHTIKDSANTSFPQRANLQIMNATITDDATNNATIVTPTGSQITFDETPTAGSNNAVKSKGIKSYVDNSIDAAITQALAAQY